MRNLTRKNRLERMERVSASSLLAAEGVLRRYAHVGMVIYDVVVGDLVKRGMAEEAEWLGDNVKWILESLLHLDLTQARGGDDGEKDEE